ALSSGGFLFAVTADALSSGGFLFAVTADALSSGGFLFAVTADALSSGDLPASASDRPGNLVHSLLHAPGVVR
ncbi:MAG: hypothetical protein ACQER1_00890, partial [Armatimonadota bacterium]